MINDIIRRLRDAIAAGPEPITTDPYGDRYFRGPHSQANLSKAQDGFVTVASPENIAALLDEIERLREWNRQMVEKAARGGTLDGYRELGAKLAAAEEKNEALAADARRIEWLATKAQIQSRHGTGHVMNIEVPITIAHFLAFSNDDVRAAIDAAMEGKG